MRQTCIFSGSSHPKLVEAICERLGKHPDKVELRKFSNGETSVEIKTSVRDQDVFIVQSGSGKINDNVMELLIMISACKGGSARSITAVVPYFPYSRQSKRKGHRGAITARMVANLMHVAGVNHVITIDLHAIQSQGFFRCPVDNLIAEPTIAKWIKSNVKDWREAVVVSKNPGGTKRVTSLADALKLSFGIVTTDTRRPKHPGPSIEGSVILGSAALDGASDARSEASSGSQNDGTEKDLHRRTSDIRDYANTNGNGGPLNDDDVFAPQRTERTHSNANGLTLGGALNVPVRGPPAASSSDENLTLGRVHSVIGTTASHPELTTYDADAESGEEFTDERARDVVTGRLIHGHIVEDDHPSPMISSMTSSHPLAQMQRANSDDDPPENMLSSFISTTSSVRRDRGLGGTADANASDEEEEEVLQDPAREATITLVGNVRDRPVFIVDDIIDKAASWIAAAEAVVKRGRATEVYCIATHGLFGDGSLQEMQECKQIDKIVITNSFPIPEEKARGITKLVTLDVSHLLAEAIRRNHHGESISQLYMHYD
ncbi:ribose phosphate diphosphokinase Prs1 [Myriangium duriaei CBS 260.36]|uniref:Ribose-phosphate pyrophosphokinase 1 n=1 Tax=Myriangium duriaei CBS 260.36 TaxID=1168546 RepID=A0A9P4J3Q4_9PEZI|nr:ribose phosphate diphosphokinase Prs1 [Myriangium duriaei CBS 260.36]